MKYIYQKRTLHSFPDYLKLKKATCTSYSYRLLGSLYRSKRSARSCKFSTDLLYCIYSMYPERTFIARTGVVGLEFYMKT